MMNNIIQRIKYEGYRYWYRLIKSLVVQTEYMNCLILVRPNEDVGMQILAGNYETNDLLYFLSQIRDGDIFFDIGANVGIFSLAVAKKNATVAVHSFEPVPINVRLFEASLCLNEISSVRLNQVCVGDYIGEVEFSLASDSAYSSIHGTGRLPELKKFMTNITTLDKYLQENKIHRIDIVKVDVEGAEKLVLDGAKNIFHDSLIRPRLVLMELFDQNFVQFKTSISEVVDYLKQLGYKPFVLENEVKTDFELRHYNKIYNVFFELDQKQ